MPPWSLYLLLGSAGAQITLKIATMSPLSGPRSQTRACSSSRGARLAVNENRTSFKELGFNLQFVVPDDQADPGTGTPAARRSVSGTSILALVGTLNSNVGIPVCSVLSTRHVAIVSPLNTANAVTDRGLSLDDGAPGPRAGMQKRYSPRRSHRV